MNLASDCLVRIDRATVSIPEVLQPLSLKRVLLRRDESSAPAKRTILNDVTFSASPGDVVGIIGRNGSGKTSFIKMVAGIYPLSAGDRLIRGRLAAVVAQGLGMDGNLSVRDNIKVALAYAGQLDSWTPELERTVLAFSELEGRAEDAFKQLSSGFQARLCFSITLFQTPDILLLDEVFATGDIGFIRKATEAMTARISETPITLIASHQPDVIRRLCTRAVLFQNGRLILEGAPSDVWAEYEKLP
jgi:lipopolysaccharide transport system ATP-binding protein